MSLLKKIIKDNCMFSFSRDGTKDNYKEIRARCKAEGVSVGSIALAASYMAMAEIHARSTCSDDFSKYSGMKEQYMDIPVNIRHRLENVNGDEYCGFYVTEVTFKCDVMLGIVSNKDSIMIIFGYKYFNKKYLQQFRTFIYKKIYSVF